MEEHRKQDDKRTESTMPASGSDQPRSGHGRPSLREKAPRGGHRVWRQHKQLLQNMDIDDLRDYLLDTEM
ncbi:MAG: hypothetical protein AB1644_04410 [Candidatus Zixiibacteriota bacterium]